MPKIDELSIFGEYGKPENRLTVALLQVLKVGSEPLIRHFAERLSFDIPSSEIAIYSQVKGQGCTPDGLLESRFTFSIVIESKLQRNAIQRKQLEALVSDRVSRAPNAVLLYLTPDESAPEALIDRPCVWANWKSVRDAFDSFLDKREVEDRELLAFLIDQFATFAGNLGVLETTWDPDDSRVLVVPAKHARSEARHFLVYACQNRRSFKPFKWIAFYAQGEIDTIAEVIAAPEDDVLLAERPEFAELAEVVRDPTNPCRVLRLSKVRSVGPIKNDLKDRNGKPAAWVQNQRYTTSDRIEKARVTSEL